MAISKIKTGSIDAGTIATGNIADDAITSDKIAANLELTGTSHMRVPVGTTAQRPESPSVGMVRYNTTTQLLEQYNSTGWVNIDIPPTISSFSGTINENTDSTLTITGSNFKAGTIVYIEGAGVSNTSRALTTTLVNSTTVTVDTNAAAVNYVAGAAFNIKVVNLSGLSAILENAGFVDSDPIWATSSGNLLTVNDRYDRINSYYPITVLNASDPDQTADPYFNSIEFLLQPTASSTTVQDISTNEKTITNTNVTLSTTITDPFGGNNKVLYFNGTSSFLRCDDIVTSLYRSPEFTIEYWYYTTNNSSADAQIAFNTSAGGNTIVVRQNELVTNGGGIAHSSVGSANAWHHVVFMLKNETYYYIRDGVLQGSTARNATISSHIKVNDTFSIGQEYDDATPGDYFVGYIYGFRITNGVARYSTSGGFTLPTTYWNTTSPLVSYSLSSGSLPTGVSVDSSTGQINGDPADVANSTTYSFAVAATSQSQSVNRSFNIIVNPSTDGSSSARAISHPDTLASFGLTTGDYYVNLAGSARLVNCVIGREGKNWIKLTPTLLESIGYTTQSNVGVTSYGWFDFSGKRYFHTYPNANDYEVWNNFALGSFSFRYVSGEVWLMGGNDSTNATSHPDVYTYDNFAANDTDYNSLGYASEGSGNKNWFRFGIADQFQLAGTELFDVEVGDFRGPSQIYIGRKTSNFKSGVSRYNTGSNATSYIDMGSSAANRVLRFSTGSESGGGVQERMSWSPLEIYLS